MDKTGLIRVPFLAAFLLFSGAAHAQIFTCKTADGRTLTSDRPIQECAKLPMRELRYDGAVKRNIAPPLTRSQREERQRRLMMERAESMRRNQEIARDRALVTAYPTMESLLQSRQRQLGAVQTQINHTYDRMLMLHRQLRAAQASMRAYPPGGAPRKLKSQVGKIASAILSEDALVKARLQEQQQIRERFEQDETRLTILLERMAEADRLAGG
jgi:hypothetical protein